MKKWMLTIGILVVLKSTSLVAAETYPNFDREYWSNEHDLAKGKMQRGFGLGVLGLVSIWPTSVMIGRAVDNPQKYFALSAVFGISTIGATLHGFGSVGFGKKQRDAASRFMGAYDDGESNVNGDAERDEYLSATRKTAKKVMLFGAVLSTQGAILLANGIVQSVRKHRGADMGSIKIWPYYLVGGFLLSAGVAIIVKSKRKLNGIDTLATLPIPSTTVSLSPYFYRGDTQGANFGVALSGVF